MKTSLKLQLVLTVLLATLSSIAVADSLTGSINGRVTDESGDPIAGLEVEVYLSYAFDEEAFEEEDDEVGLTVTDANGNYTLSDLPAGSYNVLACAGCTGLYYMNEIYNNRINYELADNIIVTAGNTTEGIDFELEPGGAFSGTVTDSQGNPIANIFVEATNYDNENLMDMDAETDSNGFYTITGLPPGDYRVGTISYETGLSYEDKFYSNKALWQNADRATITGTNTTTNINFKLTSGGAISGTVLDGQGNPIEDLHVFAEMYDGTCCGNGSNTDANGVYTIRGLRTNSYRVRACASCDNLEYADQFYDHINDWDSATEVTVVSPNTTEGIDFTLSTGTYISGYVYGWDVNEGNYAPLENAYVCVEYYSGGGGWAGADSNESGFYKVTGLTGGEYRIRVEKSPFIEQYYPDAIDWCEAEALTITAEAPAERIDFELDLGGTITGRITNEQTSLPVTANGWVNACPTNGEPWGRGGEVDSNGVYTINGLPEGSYKVDAYFEGYDQEFYEDTVDWMMATEVPVTVGNTTENINFALKSESGGSIIGRVVLPDSTPVPDAYINADSMEHMKWKNAQSDPNGEFRLTGITPGSWRLRAQPPYGVEYIDASESLEMIVDINDSATETDVGDVALTTVSLIGRALMPDDSPARHVPINIETLDWSFFQNVGTDEEGYFRVGGLSEGIYRLKLEMPWGTSGVVPPDPCEFEITDTNSIFNIGTIKYTTALKHIEGSVQKSDESGIPNVEVNGWRRGEEGWAYTRTDENGDFSIDVGPGEWELMIHPAPDSVNTDWMYMGNPKVVKFANDTTEETKNITFTIESASSQVTGCVKGPNGETIRSGTAWIDIRDDQGRGNGVSVGSGGEFSISVSSGKYNIWVGVDQQTYPYWSSPELQPFDIDEGETVDLDDIVLTEKTSGIQGQVTRSSDGEPVSGVYIHAWRHENGWADTTTDDEGNYQLSVTSGEWEVAAEPPYNSSYVRGQAPQRVIVNDDEIVADIDFELLEADGAIAGTLYDSSGNIITDIDGGWAYARQNSQYTHEPVAGSPVENGQFSFNIPDGTYLVGVHLPPNSGYSMAEEQEVTVGTESDTEVNIELLSNDSTISGTFYTDSAKTTPATDLEGEVFAMQEKQGVWQNTRIDSDGTYELRVAAGNWNLGYWIMSDGYVNNPPPDTRVNVTSGQNSTFDFVIVGADATISGVVLDPNGNAIPHAWVWAHSEGDDESKRIDCGGDARPPEGTFSISVPSGRTYEVGAHCPETWGYIQPDMQLVTPTTGANVEITLQFKQSNATITGTVSYDPGDGNTATCDQAWVNAWNEDGQHTGAMTDNEGYYQLNVSQGSTWYVDAVYHPYGDVNFYEVNEPTEVVVSSSEATADLLLFRASDTIPSATSATFDPNVGWTHTLENGTTLEIPGGAIPTTDTVCISITPLVENMRKTKNEQPLGCGYSISISEESTGNPITENFNTNVLITFTYSDERLAEEGLTEDDISPAYYSTTTNSWTKVESFTIDKENNKVKAQINHFSLWSLTGGDSGEDEETIEVAMTINTCGVKAGKTSSKNKFAISGTFDTALDSIEDANAIEVELLSVTDSYSVYTESVDFDYSNVSNGKFTYKYKVPRGGSGAISALVIDLNNKTFSLKATGVDLTGLSCPLQLEMTIGNYVLSGQADEDIVNGTRKTIPIAFLKSFKDSLNVTKAKVKSGRSGDVFVVQGTITAEDMEATNLTAQEIVITWESQTFTVPQGSLARKKANSYKCKGASAEEGGTMLGTIDFNKGVFVIAITNTTLDSKSGTIDFGISFGDFDETAQRTLGQ